MLLLIYATLRGVTPFFIIQIHRMLLLITPINASFIPDIAIQIHRMLLLIITVTVNYFCTFYSNTSYVAINQNIVYEPLECI